MFVKLMQGLQKIHYLYRTTVLCSSTYTQHFSAFVLASQIHRYNSKVQLHAGTSIQKNDIAPPDLNLKAFLKEYEHVRWLPTASITAKAVFLGYLEIGSGWAGYFRLVAMGHESQLTDRSSSCPCTSLPQRCLFLYHGMQI